MTPRESDQFSPFWIIAVLVRRWMFVAAVTALVFAAVFAYSITRQRTYVSTAAFVTQSQRNTSSNLAGIAAQIGIAVPGVEGGQSPPFFVSLLRTHDLLRNVVRKPLRDDRRGDTTPVSFARIYDIRAKNSVSSLEKSIEKLRNVLGINYEARSGIITLSVPAPSPGVAQQIGHLLLQEVSDYNLKTRHSQAAAERDFTERRLREVADSLAVAERVMRDFLEQNRAGLNSPQLSFQRDRLSSELDRRRELYSQLSRAYEQAKIDEVRDTPTLTVVDGPTLPVKPSPRGVVTRGIAGLGAGFLLGVFFVLVREYLRRSNESGDAGLAELNSAVREQFRRRSVSRAASQGAPTAERR